MKTFVCLKQVAAGDSAIRVDEGGHWVRESDLGYEMNAPDSFALEEALRIRESHGGEVVAVSAGPARTASTIREALAKGADRGLLIEDDRFSRADAYTTAQALAGCSQKRRALRPGPQRAAIRRYGVRANRHGLG